MSDTILAHRTYLKCCPFWLRYLARSDGSNIIISLRVKDGVSENCSSFIRLTADQLGLLRINVSGRRRLFNEHHEDLLFPLLIHLHTGLTVSPVTGDSRPLGKSFRGGPNQLPRGNLVDVVNSLHFRAHCGVFGFKWRLAQFRVSLGLKQMNSEWRNSWKKSIRTRLTIVVFKNSVAAAGAAPERYAMARDGAPHVNQSFFDKQAILYANLARLNRLDARQHQ